MSQSPTTASLEVIKVPLALSEAPDKETKAEEKRFDEAALTTKMTDRFCTAHKEHADYLQKEHRRLQKTNTVLQNKIDDIIPKYSALDQASKTNSRMDILSLIFAGMGAGAVGIAPYFFLNYTHILVGGGTVSLVLGYIMLGYVKLFCWPKSPEK